MKGDVKDHYTRVELRDISHDHIALLSDRRKLRDYLLQNLPIAFAGSFQHSAEIDAQLIEHVPSYNPIRVELQIEGHPEDPVQKYGPSQEQLDIYAADPDRSKKSPPTLDLKLARPVFREIHNKSGETIAFYWACLTQARARLEPGAQSRQAPQYEGLIYKMKGFSIGDRNKLRPLFPRSQLYSWYTGEVYVVDPHVIPNAARSDFESSSAKKALELALVGEFNKTLKPLAEKWQAKGKAQDVLAAYADTISAMEKDLKSEPGATPLLPDGLVERLTKLQNILDDLPTRKRAAGPQSAARADALASRSKTLLKSLSKLMQEPDAELKKRRKAPGRVGPRVGQAR